VIAGSYVSPRDAKRRVGIIRERWPDFEPETYRPPGSGPHYVVLGQRLSHEEAQALQNKARSAGIGRSTYVRQFQ
jgi:hypothetical protein